MLAPACASFSAFVQTIAKAVCDRATTPQTPNSPSSEFHLFTCRIGNSLFHFSTTFPAALCSASHVVRTGWFHRNQLCTFIFLYVVSQHNVHFFFLAADISTCVQRGQCHTR
ncbi:MAG: hypothetical protein [Circular genetic element sp.]|nr:MAG: hypothetical protein [Circular genetic element sp.]